ncbi:hypothetical protein CCR75_009404 [Bremia lactucae]|uniref:FYVE-type domain-containing protein n=1 Tax=Bremia lactucae TaxID=4779 RepID=A0A976NZA7_BRELC|nr:hypothetical protein CCR75_009404 [Bremia lactucae]
MEFPLKPGFFPQIRLTSDERSWYASIGERSAIALFKSMQTLNWKKTLDKDGVTYAQANCIEEKGSILDSPPAIVATSAFNEEPQTIASVCLMTSATAFAAGTISEVIEALASPSTRNYRREMQVLHGSRFIDGVCLHTVAAAASCNTQINIPALSTIKWAVFDDDNVQHSGGSTAGVDYCFLEHSGVHENDASQHYGFCVQESITRDKEVPSLAGLGLIRGNIHRTGILIFPTDRSDVVQVTAILQMPMAEGTPSAATQNGDATVNRSGKPCLAALARLMYRQVAAIGRLDLLLERRRLSNLVQIRRTEWVADHARKACAVCAKLFSLRRRKHHCRNCGEVVCGSCAPNREIDSDADAIINVRICTACVVQSRKGSHAQKSRAVEVMSFTDTFSLPDASYSTPSTMICRTAINNKTELITRQKALSSGSSTFSISNDSPGSVQLSEASRLLKYGDDHVELSSCNSSSKALSEFDYFENITALSPFHQDDGTTRLTQGNQQSGFTNHAIKTTQYQYSGLFTATSDMLERIREMRDDLSSLTMSKQRHGRESGSMASSTAECFKTLTDAVPGSSRSQKEGTFSNSRDLIDVDFINSSNQFTLLCPKTLVHQCRTRTSSCVHQDAGENSYLDASAADISSVSSSPRYSFKTKKSMQKVAARERSCWHSHRV